MTRVALLAALLVTGCLDDGSGMRPDALPDDAESQGSGSGNVLGGADPSPGDVTLEWMVIGLSVIVVGGSVRSRRRAPKPFSTTL